MGQTQAPFCTKFPLWPEHTPALLGCLHTSRSQSSSLVCLLKPKFQHPVPKCSSRCVGLRCAERWRAPSILVSLCSACCKPAVVLSMSLQFSSVAQLCPTLCDPHGLQHARPPVHHNSRSLFKLMSIELVIPSNHLILCHPLLLPPSIFPSNHQP